MTTTDASILGIILLLIAIIIITKPKKKKSTDENYDSNRRCDQCESAIPVDYVKSLCPRCKSYLVR